MKFEHDLPEHLDSDEELGMENSDSSDESDNEEARVNCKVETQEQICTSLDNLVNRSRKNLLSLQAHHDNLKDFAATFLKKQNELLQMTKLINKLFTELFEIVLPNGVAIHVQNENTADAVRGLSVYMSKMEEDFKKLRQLSEELAIDMQKYQRQMLENLALN